MSATNCGTKAERQRQYVARYRAKNHDEVNRRSRDAYRRLHPTTKTLVGTRCSRCDERGHNSRTCKTCITCCECGKPSEFHTSYGRLCQACLEKVAG